MVAKEPDVYRSINNLHAMLEEKDLSVKQEQSIPVYE